MSLFKSYHVQPILDRRKTHTRRKGKKRWNVGAVHQAKTEMFGEPFARLLIRSVQQQMLGEITDVDAFREGYNDVFSYIEAWNEIYGEDAWEPFEEVWDIGFELVEEAPE